MKTDPDFQPLAGAWLNGEAATPNTRLLNEILTRHDGDMDEFAALCRTESLLLLHGRSRTERMDTLRAALTRKRVAPFISPTLRRRILWAAAALIAVALGLRYFPGTPSSEEKSPPRHKPSIMPPLAKTSGRDPQKPSLSPSSSVVERRLRRTYLSAFKAQSSLPEAVALLAQSVQSQDQTFAFKPQIKSEGDAPVHLALEYPFSAWALLQMMALQTGTSVQLSGEHVIFQFDGNAAPLEGIKTSGGSTMNLRRLVLPSGNPSQMGEYEMLEGLVAKQFGSPMTTTVVMKYAMQYEATPRLARLLDYAMSLAASPPLQVQLSFHLLRAARGVNGLPVQEGYSFPSDGKPGLIGIFNPSQIVTILRVSGRQDWEVETAPSLKTLPNLSITAPNLFDRASGGKWPRAKATFTCSSDSRQMIDVRFQLDPASENPSSPPSETQVLVPDGQTLGIGGFEDPDGAQVAVFVTVQLIDSADPEPKNR